MSMPPHKSGLKSHKQKKGIPPHKQNEKGTAKAEESEEEYRHDEFDESDEENSDENPDPKKQKLDHEKGDEPHKEISDYSNSESTKNTPPPRGPKTPNAKGPETPSPTAEKTTKPASGKEGAVKCLSDFVEKEGAKYLGKLNEAVSSSENHSIEELAKSGATLSEHAGEIQKLGERLLSMSEERFNKLKKRKRTLPS